MGSLKRQNYENIPNIRNQKGKQLCVCASEALTYNGIILLEFNQQ